MVAVSETFVGRAPLHWRLGRTPDLVAPSHSVRLLRLLQNGHLTDMIEIMLR
jgi:hypothetical protein